MTRLDLLTPEERLRRGRLWRPDLDALGARIAAVALDHLGRWAIPLSPHSPTLPHPEAAGETDLARSVDDLVLYARTGRGPDWDDSTSARDLLLSVSILYASPLGGDSLPEDWTAGEHEGTRGDLAEVARAALARVHLAEGLPVPRLWLAALSGLTVKRVEQLALSGELEPVDERPARGGRGGSAARDVSAESAHAWLRARGVEGV